MKTLSVIFGRDLGHFAMIQDREAQAVQMVLDYLRTTRCRVAAARRRDFT